MIDLKKEIKEMSWRQFLIYLKGLSPNSALVQIIGEQERRRKEIIDDMDLAEKIVEDFVGR